MISPKLKNLQNPKTLSFIILFGSNNFDEKLFIISRINKLNREDKNCSARCCIRVIYYCSYTVCSEYFTLFSFSFVFLLFMLLLFLLSLVSPLLSTHLPLPHTSPLSPQPVAADVRPQLSPVVLERLPVKGASLLFSDILIIKWPRHYTVHHHSTTLPRDVISI